MLELHRFRVRYNINGIVTKCNIDAFNQRVAYCKLYWGLSKQGYAFEDIKVEKMFRLW